MKKFRLAIIIVFAFSFASALLGCANAASTSALSLVGYNHTDNGIADFSVRSLNSATSGGLLRPGEGGGSTTCCVKLPTIWNDGLTVIIRRVTYDGKDWKTVDKVVKVPKYDMGTADSLNVHFLLDGTIEVYATNMSLWHKDYPLKGLKAQLKAGIPIKPIGG
jgi:hypothetical protein